MRLILIYNHLESVGTQLADCVTVYCTAGLKTRGMANFQEVTGCFWRFNYRKDPMLFFWVSLFNSNVERDYLLKRFLNIDILVEDITFTQLHDRLVTLLNEQKLPLIFVDRFAMSYDELCYQKHHDGHYILINGYDSEQDVYHLVDFFNPNHYNTISRTLLQNALRADWWEEQPLLIVSLSKEPPVLGPKAISTIIRENVTHMDNNGNDSAGINAVHALYNDIDSRDGYLDPYISAINLFSKLKHIANYRQQHAEFLFKYYDSDELVKQFNTLSTRWSVIAHLLLKAHITKQDRIIVTLLKELEEVLTIKKIILPIYRRLDQPVHSLILK